MSALQYTPVDALEGIHATVTKTFLSGKTRPLAWRKQQLRQLYKMLDENEAAFEDSLYKDIRKPKQETLLGELAPQKQEIEDSIKSLDKWAKDESVKTGLAFKLTSAHIRKEPLGAVLIIGAWNYPISLLLGPMIGAIAAGNTIVAKPSEVSAHTAALIAELGPKYLDPEAFIFVNGAVPETTKLLELKWDLIFYTGNGTVGRIVATAAAKHLTPTVLELGGKSPAIIAKDTDVQTTARRLVWGKFFNNGQTCIAPDYVLVEESVKEPVVKAMQGYIKEFFGEDPQKSDSYGRIVNGNHFKRLTGLVAESKGSVLAHKTDETDNYISPTLVTDVTADDKLMAGEIFGPILPIMTVKNIDEAVNYINAHDQPLALYTFSKSKATIKNVMDRTRSGAALGNDSLMHFTVPTLPFGGVGPSGQGAYHGKQSFDTFSHHRASLTQPFGLEKALDARYPPYNAGKLKMLNAVLFGVLPFGKKGANADDTPRKRASMLIPPKANGTNGTTAAETPAVAPETTAATAEPAAAVESATDKVNGNGVTNGNGVAAEPATATA